MAFETPHIIMSSVPFIHVNENCRESTISTGISGAGPICVYSDFVHISWGGSSSHLLHMLLIQNLLNRQEFDESARSSVECRAFVVGVSAVA